VASPKRQSEQGYICLRSNSLRCLRGTKQSHGEERDYEVERKIKAKKRYKVNTASRGIMTGGATAVGAVQERTFFNN
jgi:hypothetical protein